MDLESNILLAGASGYVGGRLANALSDKSAHLRCMARRPDEAWFRLPANTQIIKADVLDVASLPKAVSGIHTAYYLIHSMGDGDRFAELEQQGALNFAKACQSAGVKRIIYLGGLGDKDTDLSEHLKSRHAVGRILKSTGIEVIEFRASIIIGSGSLSFEMVRALTEKLPIMVTPSWVYSKAQPIAIEDLLQYLTKTLLLPPGPSRIIEIGGKDVVSYGDLMKEYARQRNLKRFFIPVPFLTPRLSSLWLGLVTPLYARIGHKLITSIKNQTIVQDPGPAATFNIQTKTMAEAIQRALSCEDQEFGDTHWSDAISSLGNPKNLAGVHFGNRIVDSRELSLPYSTAQVFSRVQILGGRTGWYFGNVFWKIRGFIDRIVGGPGLRRGRRHPYNIQVGDAIDFWRVEAFEPQRKLRLRAEMKVPGRAWLEFTVERKDDKTLLRQTAIFDPHGLAGRLYWYALYPVHAFIFKGMLKAIGKEPIARTLPQSLAVEYN